MSPCFKSKERWSFAKTPGNLFVMPLNSRTGSMNTSKNEKLAALYAGRRVLPFYHTPVLGGRIKKVQSRLGSALFLNRTNPNKRLRGG
jgi:hypothetical protein